MSTISKKIFAIVTTLTLSVMLVGPVQAVTIDELLAQIAALQAQLLQLQQQQTGGGVSLTACSGITFTRNLSQGMSGADVKCLQASLNSSADTQVAASGVGSAGSETMFFGPLTKAAVVKFQVKYAATVLTPIGLTNGTGFVGSMTRAKLTSLLGTTPTTPTTPTTGGPAGENKVQLAADSPAASPVAKGAQDIVFSKINFCAGSAANTVSKIIITRAGLAADTDFSYIKLYDGITQIGATQALNQSTHKASFSSLSLVIPANSCKTVAVKASLATGATAGNAPKLGINAASDITSTVALDGVFPILSNGMTIAGISVGYIEVAAQTTPSGSIIAGGVEQAVAAFKFTASSSEGVKINSLTLREVGSSVDSDVSNMKLFYGSTQVGSTVASLTNGLVTFDLSSAPVEVLASASKTLTLYVDLGTSTGVASRTIKFEITQATDVTAYGTNSGGIVVARGTSLAADSWAQSGQSITVVLGGLTVAQDTSYAPSAQTYVIGTVADSMNAFKFSTGAYEGIRITQIKLTATGTGSGNDANVSNVGLYDTDGTLLAGPVGMISGTVTFGSYTTGLDATGLFDIAKSSNKTIIVKADIPSGASSSATIGFAIKIPNTDVKADGLTSQNDLATTDINPSTTLPATPLVHTIGAYGTLTVSKNASSPSAATYALGVTAYNLAKFDFTSTGEDIVISQINILMATSAIVTSAAAVGDVNNIKLYDGGSLIATDPTISSGMAQFGVNLTIPKNTTKTLTVIGDIPSASAAASLIAVIKEAGDIVSTGKDSSVSLATAGSFGVFANLMSKGTPSVTVIAATTPVAQTYIKGTSGALVGTFYFTAGTAEDVKITSIRLVADISTTTVATSSFAAADVVALSSYTSNMKLYDGAAQVGSTQPTWTDGTNYDYVTFSLSSPLLIPKGTTKSIDVKTDVLNSTTTLIFVGFSASTDISGTGLSSGQTATITMEGGGIAGRGMTFGSSGTLVIALDVNTPSAAQVMANTTANEFGRWKFSAVNENINLSKLTFEVTQSSAASGTSVGSKAMSTTSPNIFATSTTSFYYSIDDAATQTCTVATTTINEWTAAHYAAELNNDCPDLLASASAGVITLWASTTKSSLEITSHPVAATDAADNLAIGLKFGGTETIGNVAGSNNSVVKVTLYDGASPLADAYVSAETANKVIFNFPSGSEIVVSRTLPKVLSLKVDLSTYVGAVEGSTLRFDLGNGVTNYVSLITAKGGSSGTALDTTGNITSGSSATNTALVGNAMYIYATKPTVSLSASSPSGSQIGGTSKEVFRFDVANSPSGFDLAINAIRFTIGTVATSSIFDRTFNLYNANDITTSLGSGKSWANGTSTATVGYVTIYPVAGNQVSSGSTVTYVLKGDTSGALNITSGADPLTFSIEDGDFYWDDSASISGAANSNQKVRILPVAGGTLTY